MPGTKIWTETDRVRAIAWVDRKASASLFRGEARSKSARLERIRAANGDHPEILREELTEEAWKALLTALRQRKHVDKVTEGAGEDAVEVVGRSLVVDGRECMLTKRGQEDLRICAAPDPLTALGVVIRSVRVMARKNLNIDLYGLVAEIEAEIEMEEMDAE